jgi:hypothetical protein
MKSRIQNKSELMLENYLNERRILFSKIPEFLPDEKPDYFVRVGEITILCELKTLDPSSNDKVISRLLAKSNPRVGKPFVFEKKTYKSIRNLIGDANRQLKGFDCLGLPGVLVLLCNRISENYNVSRETVWEAMFGSQAYEIDPVRKVATSVGKKDVKLRANTNTHISAVATAIVSSGVIKSFVVYHNPFARHPLSEKIFTASDKNVIPSKITFDDI